MHQASRFYHTSVDKPVPDICERGSYCGDGNTCVKVRRPRADWTPVLPLRAYTAAAFALQGSSWNRCHGAEVPSAQPGPDLPSVHALLQNPADCGKLGTPCCVVSFSPVGGPRACAVDGQVAVCGSSVQCPDHNAEIGFCCNLPSSLAGYHHLVPPGRAVLPFPARQLPGHLHCLPRPCAGGAAGEEWCAWGQKWYQTGPEPGGVVPTVHNGHVAVLATRSVPILP